MIIFCKHGSRLSGGLFLHFASFHSGVSLFKGRSPYLQRKSCERNYEVVVVLMMKTVLGY